jgi:hypothetical protein
MTGQAASWVLSRVRFRTPPARDVACIRQWLNGQGRFEEPYHRDWANPVIPHAR